MLPLLHARSRSLGRATALAKQLACCITVMLGGW